MVSVDQDDALRLQVCLAGSMQEDDCAAESHGCWTHTEGKKQFSACKDTFRGYVCKCPEGDDLQTSDGNRNLPGSSRCHLYCIATCKQIRTELLITATSKCLRVGHH